MTRASYRAALNTLLVLFIAEGVGTGAVLLRDDYGYFVGGAVMEEARGRGAYRFLVEARLAFLRDRGIEYAVTIAREATSAPIGPGVPGVGGFASSPDPLAAVEACGTHAVYEAHGERVVRITP